MNYSQGVGYSTFGDWDMETTIGLLDRAKKAAGCESDYAFAKKYGLRTNTMSQYRTGKHQFDDSTAELVAGILGLEPGYVIACCQAQRQKDEAGKARWARIAAILAVAALPPAAGASQGSTVNNVSDPMCIMSNGRRQIRALFSGILPRFHFA